MNMNTIYVMLGFIFVYAIISSVLDKNKQRKAKSKEALERLQSKSYRKELERLIDFSQSDALNIATLRKAYFLQYPEAKKLLEIKKTKKEQLAKYIQNTTGITVNTDSIFDVQVKRLHEYKRQLLNALHIVYLYREIKYNGLRPVPRTFIFAAKASSGYQMAKNIIKFIHSISQMIEADELVREYIKVVFLPDYKVTLAEKIIPAADVSEQISQAGKEASGTGNMKLMLNGALTLGTLDGANVEIHEAVGDENIFIFGLETPQVEELNRQGYKPWEYYMNSEKIKNTLDFIRTMTVGGMNFSFIVDYLLTQDNYMCLADFESYVAAQERVAETYSDKEKWGRMSLINTANAGIFSADRSVEEYAKDIWNIKKVK